MINLNAINKLNDEVKDSKNEYKKLIVAHLVKRIKEDSGLGDDVAKDGKSLEGCLLYIKGHAQKSSVNGVAAIEDRQVYEWAEDYYRSETPEPVGKPDTKKALKPPKVDNKEVKNSKKPIPIPQDSQISLFDDGIIDETDNLWLF